MCGFFYSEVQTISNVKPKEKKIIIQDWFEEMRYRKRFL